MPRIAKVDFVFFDAGGGHRAAATALEAAVLEAGYPWDVTLVNLQEVLDPLDIFRKFTGIRLQDIYNRMLARGLTWGGWFWVPVIQFFIRRYHRSTVRLLIDFWRRREPDMVVSLIPNLNRALFESLQCALPGTPYATIMTDFADYPPHFWMEPQDQLIICGTERAYQQALDCGYSPERIRLVDGMILRPVFYQTRCVNRGAERIALGLDPNLPTGLVMFGGEGSNVMYALAHRLGNSHLPLQLIMICGRNQALQKRLRAIKTRNKMIVLGFTKDVPQYMALADFFIGKPGPGSISEALHMGLPVIVESNSWTLPQERYNTQWIQEHGYGKVLHNLRDVEAAVTDMIGDGALAAWKARVAHFENRALFQIGPILEELLENSGFAFTGSPATNVADSAD